MIIRDNFTGYPFKITHTSRKICQKVIALNLNKSGEEQYKLLQPGNKHTTGENNVDMINLTPGQAPIGQVALINIEDAIKIIQQVGDQIEEPQFPIPYYEWLALFFEPDYN